MNTKTESIRELIKEDTGTGGELSYFTTIEDGPQFITLIYSASSAALAADAYRNAAAWCNKFNRFYRYSALAEKAMDEGGLCVRVCVCVV